MKVALFSTARTSIQVGVSGLDVSRSISPHCRAGWCVASAVAFCGRLLLHRHRDGQSHRWFRASGTDELPRQPEMLPGYFVQRFSRRTKSYHCRECQAENYYTQENEVDTTMVADMLRLAAVGAFDILVLMSGMPITLQPSRACGRWVVRPMSRRGAELVCRGGFVGRRLITLTCATLLGDCGRQWPTGEGEDNGSPIIPDRNPQITQGEDTGPPSVPISDNEEVAATVLLDEVRRAESKFPRLRRREFL